MKRYQAEQIRNVGLFGHSATGKTSLADAMLYDAGGTDRQGHPDDSSSMFDFDPDEAKRKISISASMAPLEWKGDKINLIDTPGFMDFIAEVIGTMRVIDTAAIVVSAQAGVEVGTERIWDMAERYNLPKLIFVNRMDKENANFDRVLDMVSTVLLGKIAPVQYPIGSAEQFKGIIDLIGLKAYVFDKKEVKEEDIPKDLQEKVQSLREKLIEAAAESDDDLLTKYLDGGTLSPDEIKKGLRSGMIAGKVVPILCGSAYKNIGIQPFLDFINQYCPSPKDRPLPTVSLLKDKSSKPLPLTENDPLSLLIWKTTADPYVGKLSFFKVYSGVFKGDVHVLNPLKDKEEKVHSLLFMKGKVQENTSIVPAGDIGCVAKLQFSSTGDSLCDKERLLTFEPFSFPLPMTQMSITAKSKADEDKLGSALTRLAEEDPTFNSKRDAEIHQTIISGMGEMHLEITMDRLKRKFGVEVDLEIPRIPYKETIKGRVQVEGKHKKQSGGRGQFGHVWLELEPLPKGKHFEYIDKVVGGAVPRQYIPAVEKGVREAMEEGILAGYHVTDIRVTLYDGSYHSVDSSEMAFKIAGSLALKKGMQEARPILLEPIMEMEILVPEANMGDVMGDINSKRGRILGMEPRPKNQQLVRALAPLAEVQRYSIDLRSMTQGRGSYTMKFAQYEEAPPNITETVVASAKKEKDKVSV